MMPIDKQGCLRNVMFNIAVSAVLVLLMWLTGSYIKGPISYIGLVLYAPSFIIISLLKGTNVALHFTTYWANLIVSFLFYSVIIALIQWFVYKRKKKRQKTS